MSCSSFRTLIPPGIVSVLPVAHALTKLWRTHTCIGRLRRPLRWQTMTGLTFVARMRRCTWLKHAASPETIVVSAIVGAAGLRPTLRAIELGGFRCSQQGNLSLRWRIGQQALKSSPGTLWPVDSEHAPSPNACGGFVLIKIKSIVLTASGGPFRDTPLSDLRDVTPQQALKHPVWDMGPRIIDSATMANKALELIEAHHLFGVSDQQLEAIVHPAHWSTAWCTCVMAPRSCKCVPRIWRVQSVGHSPRANMMRPSLRPSTPFS